MYVSSVGAPLCRSKIGSPPAWSDSLPGSGQHFCTPGVGGVDLAWDVLELLHYELHGAEKGVTMTVTAKSGL